MPYLFVYRSVRVRTSEWFTTRTLKTAYANEIIIILNSKLKHLFAKQIKTPLRPTTYILNIMHSVLWMLILSRVSVLENLWRKAVWRGWNIWFSVGVCMWSSLFSSCHQISKLARWHVKDPGREYLMRISLVLI